MFQLSALPVLVSIISKVDNTIAGQDDTIFCAEGIESVSKNVLGCPGSSEWQHFPESMCSSITVCVQ